MRQDFAVFEQRERAAAECGIYGKQLH